MMRSALPLLPAFALLASLPAQTPIGYPADTVRAGSGNLSPFGLNTTGTADEARWQQLIPAQYLPSTGCLITGLAVNCQSSNAAVTYTSLQITLSHTTAAALGGSFSGNLPAPFLVLTLTNQSIAWSINRWVDVTFTTPFPYNGTDNLVVSIQKVYDRVTNPVPGIVTHQTSGSPSRRDLVPSRYAFGTFGSGAAMTDTPGFSGMPLSMRLWCIGPGTMTVRSLAQPAGPEFQINTAMDTTVWGAPGTFWLTVLDGAMGSPASFPGIGGSLWIQPRIVLASGAVPAGGASVLFLGIPNDPLLVGGYLALQSLLIDPTLTSLSWSNAVDLFIN
jgi:hypothetical protein